MTAIRVAETLALWRANSCPEPPWGWGKVVSVAREVDGLSWRENAPRCQKWVVTSRDHVGQCQLPAGHDGPCKRRK